MVSTQRKPKRLKVKAGLMKNHIVNGSGIDILIDDFIGKVLSVPFCPYHFVCIPFCPRTLETPYKSVKFRGRITNSSAQLEIPRPAEICGP